MRVTFAVAALAGLAFGYETRCNDFGGRQIEYIDRHIVNCPDGKALKHWTFTRCGDSSDFKASYGCNDIPGTAGTLTERLTGCSHLQGQSLEFLDRQNLACAEGEVMQGFSLVRAGCGGADMQFKVYCRAFDASSTFVAHARGSGCNEIDRQPIEYLDRHVPDCGTDFMSQWYMTRSGCSGSNQRIAATCLTLTQPTCDYACYLARYEDLQNAHGADTVGAMNHYKEYGRDEGRDCTCSCPDADDERVGDECCPPDRTIFNWDTFEATACCPVGQVVSMTNTCVADATPAPVDPIPEPVDPIPEPVDPTPGPIDTLEKLRAWCNEDVANCRTCKGKDQDDGSCKVKDKKIAKCKLFKGNDVCDRIAGCRSSVKVKKNKTKVSCKGGKHNLA